MKTVLITGGAHGIGAATVRRFAGAGWGVSFTYVHPGEDAQLLCRETGAAGLCADVTDARAMAEAVRQVLQRWKHIDVLVNNAGISARGLLLDASDEDYRRVMDVNVFGTFCSMRAVLPEMIRRRSGCIINLASMWGEIGAAGEALYSASKAAVIGLTKAAARELSSAGIRVNAVSPGFIDTRMNASLTQQERDAFLAELPLGRAGTPEEVADAICYLASDAASYITGQILPVSGGMVI